VHSSTARTRPEDATVFVDDTEVDALAVAVGSSHAMTERTTKLDLELVGRLRAAVDVPLVLHGSSGVPDDELVRAISAGLTKINIGTHLNATLTRGVRHQLEDQPRLVDPRKYLGPARDDVAAEVERRLRLFSKAA
jgi:fructose-bisphosphate aldolase class II